MIVELFFSAIGCCQDSSWSLTTEDRLKEMSRHGINSTHIRLGPFWDRNESKRKHAYLGYPGSPDLLHFNPEYWDYLDSICTVADRLNITLEISLIDSWTFKHCEFSPWPDCGPWLKLNPPTSIQLLWLEQIAKVTKNHKVKYEISNESFDSGGTLPMWELAIAQYMKSLAPKVKIGSNSMNPDILSSSLIDYVNVHTQKCPENIYGKPLFVNEYPYEGYEDLDEYIQEQIIECYNKNVGFTYWRGNDDNTQWENMLRWMRDFRIKVDKGYHPIIINPEYLRQEIN